MNEKLRIGVLLDSLEVPAWEYAMIERIANSYFAHIELIVLNDGERLYKSNVDKLRKNWHQIIYYLFNKIDRILFRSDPDAFAEKDLMNLLPEVSVLKVKPRRTKFSDYIEAEDITQITSHKIDVFVRMGFRIIRGDILKVSRYGIWSYHHGDNLVNRGGPPGFWEVVESWPTTGSILQIISNELDAGKVLYRSWSCTHNLSVTKNKKRYYWKSLSFLPRKLEELYNIGEEKYFERINNYNKDIDLYAERLYKAPSNLLALKLAASQLVKIFRHLLRKLICLDQWILMFDLKKDISTWPSKFKKIMPPKDRFWADPHVLIRNGKYYVFIEEFMFYTKKGHISVIEIDQNGKYGKIRKVLEKDYHLSYPFVLESEEKIYMVPDSHENRTIEIYECIDFPYKWEFKMNLMENIDTVDTTLLYHNNKWWLFTAISEYEGAERDELYIFCADSLLTTNWEAHPLNPVISDVKSARPAGKIFKKHGKIYRPSQDCSHHYGYGFKIQEITVLTETSYDEITVTSVEPNWEKEIAGTHSFAYEEGITVIDALVRRSRLF